MKIQIRRDTTTGWSTANPTLALGEWGMDTTLNKVKLGDGSTAWNSLAFNSSGTADKIVASGTARTIYVQSTTPSSPAVGDIWIKTA